MPSYEYTDDVSNLPVGLQVDAEEEIAGIIFEAIRNEVGAYGDGLETVCQELGKTILLRTLCVFRPDLVREAA